MKLQRLAALLMCWGIALGAGAADFPTRPLRVIVPYGPGGVDGQMRLLEPYFTKLLGQPVVVENRDGAGGAIGTKLVKDSPPDGYTLLYAGTQALAILPYMRKVPFAMEDFVPIGNATGTALAVAVRADAPYRTFAEMIAYAKQNPGKIRFGTAGAGTATHMIPEAIQFETGTTFTHVPYRGVGAAVTAMLGGFVDLVVGFPAVLVPHAEAGKFRILATTGRVRSEFVPNVPTLREAGLTIVEETRMSLFAPAGVPDDVTRRLQEAFAAAVKSPEFAAAMKKTSTTVLYLDANGQREAMKADAAYWNNLFQKTRILESIGQ